jgi:hypothetical protein
MGTKSIYTQAGPAGLIIDVTLNAEAPDADSFPHDLGVVLRRRKRGYVLPWSEVVQHLRFLLQHSPEARRDIEALLQEVTS